MTEAILGICNILEKRVRRSLVRISLLQRITITYPAGIRQPRFSFFNYSIVKELKQPKSFRWLKDNPFVLSINH